MASGSENGDKKEETEAVEEGSDIGKDENAAPQENSKEVVVEREAEEKGGEKEANGEEKGDEEEEEVEEKVAPGPDKAALKEQFTLFAKFGDKTADGKSIKLSQSDKWFKQAKVIDGKNISTTDTGIAFRKIAKNSPKLSFAGWVKYLEEISSCKKIPVNTMKHQLVDCGKPGLSGATSVVKNAAVDRLTDSTRYGGTHKNRFDSTGKGKGKEGRVDPKSDGYVTGYKQKGTYDKER